MVSSNAKHMLLKGLLVQLLGLHGERGGTAVLIVRRVRLVRAMVSSAAKYRHSKISLFSCWACDEATEVVVGTP